MTPRERAYILRIAAILETGESAIGVRNLMQQMQHDNPAWDAAAITAAVAYVRASLLRIPYTQLRYDIAA